MSARAIWEAEIKAGTQKVPVKLYSAVEDHAVHFHMLDRRTRSRVKQRMVDPETGEEVAHAEIRKGYEVEPGTFVILDEAELEELEPEASRQIDIVHFLPPQQIRQQWYERPYYLGPDGDTSSYFALAEALTKSKKEGLAKWVMRGRQYFGALRAEGDYLVLITLRNTDEVLLPQELPAPKTRESTKAELRMAEELISILEGPFDPSEFRDEYRERLEAFLRARAKGRRPKLHRVTTKRVSKSLERDLARSIEAMKRDHEKAAA
jgi:DNA end-binding protein Ku